MEMKPVRHAARTGPPRTRLCFSLSHCRDIFHRHPHPHTGVSCFTFMHPDCNLFQDKMQHHKIIFFLRETCGPPWIISWVPSPVAISLEKLNVTSSASMWQVSSPSFISFSYSFTHVCTPRDFARSKTLAFEWTYGLRGYMTSFWRSFAETGSTFATS